MPRWCDGYLEQLPEQASIDPDTIFGKRVPECCLEKVFPEALYRLVRRSLPQKRKRGSSGNWRKDRLSKTEIGEYKRRMGLKRGWDLEAVKAMVSVDETPPGKRARALFRSTTATRR